MWLLLFQDRGAAFLASLVTGVVIGLIYDVFRVGRAIFGGGRVKLFFEDVLFFVMSALVFTVFMFNATFGVVRMFAAFGALVGFFAYRFSIGLFTVLAARKLKALFTPPLRRAAKAFKAKKALFCARRYTASQAAAVRRRAEKGFA